MLTKLWYQLKKYAPNFYIDNNCSYCVQSLKNLKRNKIEKDDVIILVPSMNHAGVIIDWHIGRTKLEYISSNAQIIQDMKQEE